MINTNNSIVLLSDVHGQAGWHKELIGKYEFTLQLGDLGFWYDYLKDVDPNKHVFISGNHDNHNRLENTPPAHYLGRYGLKTLNGVEFFYVSGAFSIDRKYRMEYVDWWPNEELSDLEFKNAYELYCDIKPKMMFTHECPRCISEIIGNPSVLQSFGFDPAKFSTRTSVWLQKMYDAWQPKLWVFGHFHRHHDILHNPEFSIVTGPYPNPTRFICLPDLFKGRKQTLLRIDNEANIEYMYR